MYIAMSRQGRIQDFSKGGDSCRGERGDYSLSDHQNLASYTFLMC